MASKYDIRQEPLAGLFADRVGRRIVAAEPVTHFSHLPFAGDVGDWTLPDGSYMWVAFDDGAYWLSATPDGGERRWFALRPTSGGEVSTASTEE